MIEAIAIAIAVLGAVLLLILFARIRAVDAELKLKKHRAKDAGLADLLNYAAVVDDGVIVGKNGSFMAAWLYKGDDNASSTEEQREMVSFRINQALAGLGNGWMVHVDAVRRPAPNYSERGVSSFPDSVSFAIDEERRRLFEGLGAMFEGYFVLTVTWFPPVLAQRKFVELMFDDDAVAPDHTARTTGLIAQFKREITSLESRLSSAVKMTRLRGQKVVSEEGREVTHDDFLSWLQFCVTGLHHPVMLPSNPMYLDAVIGGQELWGGVVPKIGRKFIQVVAIEGFPLESTPGVLSALAELPSEYRWSSRFIFMDQHESLKHLDKFRKKWKQKIRGFFDQVFNTNTCSSDWSPAPCENPFFWPSLWRSWSARKAHWPPATPATSARRSSPAYRCPSPTAARHSSRRQRPWSCWPTLGMRRSSTSAGAPAHYGPARPMRPLHYAVRSRPGRTWWRAASRRSRSW